MTAVITTCNLIIAFSSLSSACLSLAWRRQSKRWAAQAHISAERASRERREIQKLQGGPAWADEDVSGC